MIAERLKKGDSIGIVAPSKVINEEQKEQLKNFEKYIQEEGFKVVHSKNLFAVDNYERIAGTPEQRADDFNSMVKDKEIKAVWCFQGGSAANQILELMDYNAIKKNPKLIMGKSDIDVLLLAINKMTSLITFHCCDPKIGRNREMDFDYTKKWFQKRLINGEKEIEASEDWVCVREGKAEGRLLGCNLNSILKLAGTKYFPDFNDSILFVETYHGEVGKLVYIITQLDIIGALAKVKAIVVGHNFEWDGGSKNTKTEDVVKDLTEKYRIPILKINEFGHYQPHSFLPIGAKVMVDATNKKIEIISEFLS